MMNGNSKIYSKSEILDMAKELGLALASSEIMLRYRESEKKVAEDYEACCLTRVFKETRKKLALLADMKDAGKEEIEACIKELEEADQNMKKHPLISEFYKTGAEFNTLIYQINQLLKFFSMDEDEIGQFSSADACKGCSGCK